MTNTKVIIVEDEANLRQTLSDVLSVKGYTVETANDGQAGFELIKKSLPDIVISDIMMPIKDGFEIQRINTARSSYFSNSKGWV